MKNIVDDFFIKLGNDRNFVSVKIVDNTEILARARGMKLNNIPLGQIHINGILFNKLSSGKNFY